jgi:hypothetical protein
LLAEVTKAREATAAAMLAAKTRLPWQRGRHWRGY